MSWAADDQDGNGLHLKKSEANFFQVYCFCLGKLAKTLMMVYFQSSKIHLISSF